MKATVSRTTPTGNNPPPFRAIAVVALSSVIYLLLVSLSIGLKVEHIAFVTLYNVGFAMHASTRKLVAALTVFLVYGMLYDAMKAWPNHLFNSVDIEGLYLLEKRLFGIPTGNTVLTPNEYFTAHATTFLDLVTGLTYLNWVSVPLLFGVYLYVRDKRGYLDFALVFLLVNILGFVIYYLHPAAPPWYVEQYGFTYREGISSSAAGLLRFDRLFSMEIFRTLYTRNSQVFAALPSLHAAYPLVVLYYGIRTRRGPLMNTFFVLFTLGIWFAAVYTNHHYVIDVALGAFCAVAGIVLYHGVLCRISAVRKALQRYERFIS